MLRAVTGHSTRTDLAAIAHELAEKGDVLVIDPVLLVCAELAVLLLAFTRRSRAWPSSSSQLETSLVHAAARTARYGGRRRSAPVLGRATLGSAAGTLRLLYLSGRPTQRRSDLVHLN